MNRSDNNFAKLTFSESSNNFSSGVISESSNTFQDSAMDKGLNVWEGDNLTSDAYGNDEFGNPFGINEYGGIDHFKKLTPPTINH